MFFKIAVFIVVTAGAFSLIRYVEREALRWWWMRRLAPGHSRAGIKQRKRLPFEDLMVRMGEHVMPDDEKRIEELRLQLSYAGFRSERAVTLFFGLKICLALSAGCVYILSMMLASGVSPRTLISACIPLAAGYYLPDMLLRAGVRQRRNRIHKELPDMLDLTLVCIDAGLSFDMALARVSRDLAGIAPVLAREFARYSLEIRSGLSRRKVMDNMARRNGVQSLSSVISVISQSFRLGTDMAEALRVHMDGMRTEQRQNAEEKAGKITTKLTFPLVILILPALFIIILGPSLINLFDRLSKGF